jgi:kynurenine formamidase
MARESWNRWGAEDQRGALNRIGPDQVLAATLLVKQGRAISLAQPISAQMPVPPKRPRPAHFMSRDGGDYAGGARRPGGFQYAEDTVLLTLHGGTHIDCLCHVWYDDTLFNGFSSNIVTSAGAARCGAETLPPMVTRGVLLDFVALAGKPLADGAAIGIELVKQACAAAGVSIGEGDAVLLRTGWQEAHADAGTQDYNSEPGLDLEAALWLAEQGAAIIGADNYAVEVLPFAAGTVFPVHQRLIRDFGIPLLEGLVLKPLAAAGGKAFLFMAAALPITGATGSPLNPVAVI